MLVLPQSAWPDQGTDRERTDPWYRDKVEEPDVEWAEDNPAIPAYPRVADLKPLHESRGSRFEFLIDTTSLSKGQDSVVRYTAVVRAPGGAENVFYEGIRCSDKTYKTYAYGNPQSRSMRVQRKPRWRTVKSSPGDTALGFRPLLLRRYLCNVDNIPNEARAVVSLLHHYPGRRSPDSYD
ncbi:MAG: CNP1-like family protein [Gammaproteobacteria bacterium]